MTALFDEKARENFTSNIYLMPKGMDDIRIKDIKVCQMNKNLAREYISMFHYSKTFPDSTIYCYGAYYNGYILGVICYGMGCGKNQYTAVIPDIQNGEYIELTRLWCSDNSPKNIESYLISHSLKMLPERIKLVISFSDEAEGHCGIIYQATNFYYLGINDGGKMLEMPDGVKKHPRLLGVYRMRHPEYKSLTNDELLNVLDLKFVGGGRKHRYVYFRGTRREKKIMYESIKERIRPYPKVDVKKPDFSENKKVNEQIQKQGYRQTNIFDFLQGGD